jgi:pimeloyl-ACP methyl ester carboxylesterase
MFYHAKNGLLRTGGKETYYVRFGTGRKNLIILPGVGDGFKTAKGVAVPFALMYRRFAKAYTVYVFSRRNDLPEGFTTADMADDLAEAMDALGIAKADFIGVSQGGMITEQMAIRYPEKTGKIVLAVTTARPTQVLTEAIDRWLKMAAQRDYKSIMLDTAERSYTGRYKEKQLRMYRLLSGLTKPKDFTRFNRLVKSCLAHDVYDQLGQIKSPALVIGGTQDLVAGPEGSHETATQIPNSELYMYEGLSHGLYEQAPDFYDRVELFLRKS